MNSNVSTRNIIEREVVKLLSYDRTIVFFVNLQYEVVNLLKTAELASYEVPVKRVRASALCSFFNTDSSIAL